MPGWLTLAHLTDSSHYYSTLMQRTAKVWELEIKITTDFIPPVPGKTEQFRVAVMNNFPMVYYLDPTLVSLIDISCDSAGEVRVIIGNKTLGPYQQGNYWLRLTGDTGNFTTSYSLDGENYSQIYEVTSKQGEPKYLGMQLYSHIDTPQFKAHIDYFRYRVLEDWED